MAKLAKPAPRPLWPSMKYDLHTIASGLPVECVRGAADDYQCTHVAFLQGLYRFARKHDVVFRAEPLRDGTEQVGWTVQFFWDLHRTSGHPVPDSFRYPEEDDPEVFARCSPYVRPMYATIPQQRRLPVTLK